MVEVHIRRFLLQPCALEVFCSQSKSCLLVFRVSEVERAFNKIVGACFHKQKGAPMSKTGSLWQLATRNQALSFYSANVVHFERQRQSNLKSALMVSFAKCL